MKQYAILFCHVTKESFYPDITQELLRQYNLLCQYANSHDLPIECCFFHTGSLNAHNSDDVFSRFLCCAQENKAGLILIERIEQIPVDQRNLFPPIEICSVSDNILIRIGKGNYQSVQDCIIPRKIYGYCRYACASQFDGG